MGSRCAAEDCDSQDTYEVDVSTGGPSFSVYLCRKHHDKAHEEGFC